MFACLHAAGNLPLLLECARQFSPLVEETSPDTVVLDIDGLEPLWGTPDDIARALMQRNGVGASVAIARNPDAAIHVARGIAGVTVIPAGGEACVLAPLPLNLMGGSASPETAETLDLWGIRTFGELAALPPLGVAARLGDEGVHLQRLARGEADRLLRLPGEALNFEEAFELDYPLELLEPLSFLLARMLNDLCARLAARSLATNEIRLRLDLENANPHTATLRLPVPIRDPKAFLKLLQLELSDHPPAAPVLKVALALEPVKPRAQQHGLFIPVAPEPEKLELTLARIAGIVGAENVGSAERLDTHRPDSFVMRRFAAQRPEKSQAAVLPEETHLALRRLRPAAHAQVLAQDSRPVQIASAPARGRVLACAGPWRTSGEWWLPNAWNRDEWDVALNDGGLYRVYQDLSSGRWFIEGYYD